MTAPRVSYAHLLVQPNPRHVRSLVRFFEEGCSAPGTGGFGVEIEHLPVHNADDTAVTYGEPNGVEELLRRLPSCVLQMLRPALLTDLPPHL